MSPLQIINLDDTLLFDIALRYGGRRQRDGTFKLKIIHRTTILEQPLLELDKEELSLNYSIHRLARLETRLVKNILLVSSLKELPNLP